MELEQRVQALEQELQILKNQIQAILLDIQEQVLSNTYPDLRANDAPSRSDPEPAPQPEMPIRKVSFSPVDEQPDAASAPAARPVKKDKPHLDKAKLEAWALQKLDEVGEQETYTLIRAQANKGRITQEVCDALLNLVESQANMYYDAPTQPSNPRSFEVPARMMQDTRALQTFPADIAHTARRQTASQPQLEKPHSRNPKITRTIQAEDGKRNSQSMVLRLIAGIQNAGAGVRWSKK